MANKNPLKKLLFLFLLCLCDQAIAQNVAPNIKSPNVASMERFGDIPVSLFTGVPDIAIPLYTLNSGNISIPISLRYHPASVKVAQHPSWVGLGWDLNITGSISRTVNNLRDEDNYLRFNDSKFRSFYPDPSVTNSNNQCGGKFVQDASWTALQNQYNAQFSLPAPNPSPELNPDEFSFNFLGHSGTFYYAGPIAGWIVKSDENITVEVNSFLAAADIATIINSYEKIYSYSTYPITDQNHSRSFGEFTLTTEDGTRYTFGGISAVEFHTDYFFDYTGEIVTDSWLLKKIADSNGHEVTYTYTKDYRTCNLNYFNENSNINDTTIRPADATFPQMTVSSGSCSTWSQISTNDIEGQMLFPVYLSKITSDKETIELENNIVTSLRYTNAEFNVNKPGTNSPPQQIKIGTDGAYLKWKKLTKIRVKDIANNIVMGYDFNYNESSSQRFSLASLNVLPFPASPVIPNKVYQFEYDNIAALPPYNGNFSDHWGFYNGKNIMTVQRIFSGRETDPLFVTKGLLSKLTYPTGGYSEFVWEAHEHSRKVNLQRTDLEPYPNVPADSKYAGGSRISEIKGFSSLGNLVSSKKYYYVSGYNSNSIVSSLPSSGVLNGKPLYLFQILNRLFTTTTNSTFTTTSNISILSVHSSANYGFAGNGSHIGYDQVVEKNMDNSYTKHFFTNYGADINGQSHFDKVPQFSAGWQSGDASYMPYSSLELERGKEIGTFSYGSNNQLVKKNIVTYRDDTGRFNQFTKQIFIKNIFFCTNSFTQFAAGINAFLYKYYPIKNETTTYDVDGNNGITETKRFTYNSKNQLASELNETSVANKTLTAKYLYPQDFPSEQYMTRLNARNMIGRPVKTQTFVNDVKTAEQKTIYNWEGLPTTQYQAYFPNTFPNITLYEIGNLEKKAEYKYDDKGNPLEILPANGIAVSYIWGYNKTLPIAKIENATSAQIAALGFPTSTAGLTAAQETTLRTSLPNAMVTTYSYIPLMGISTITDPKGDKTTYTYDAFGRLEFIKDNNGNILSDNQYNYKP